MILSVGLKVSRQQLVRPVPLLSSRRFLAQGVDAPTEDNQPFRIPLSEDSFDTYNIDPPPCSVETTKSQLKRIYYDILTIRRMEMAADKLYKQQKIRGFCHLSTGQEAIAVGIEHAITRNDKLITAYRSHGFTLMRGGTVSSIIGEPLGRQGGISYGKGGSMHMFCPGFYGGNGIVGASVPVGAGIAWAQKFNGNDSVTLDIYGDGAANQGQVYETFNMVKLWDLPVIFCCENNHYGMGTAAERASASTEYYKRAQYIPGLRVNGMDVLSVLSAVRYGRDYVRAGNGPLVFEYVTYRYTGHSMSDPGTQYRSREELRAQREYDPLDSLKVRLLDWGVFTEDEARKIEAEAQKRVKQEVEVAEKMTEPPNALDVLFQGIYARESEPRQRRGRSVDESIHGSG